MGLFWAERGPILPRWVGCVERGRCARAAVVPDTQRNDRSGGARECDRRPHMRQAVAA